uniref:Uncharacterized protein n=1 Tax=Daphnia galeata TaxID=27404 RepID=A0A8J2RYN2_9CRUS|nr:unnamed protein product [Daphnia galeata]
MKVALFLFAFTVVALAVPTNRPRKVFRPNRVNRRIEGRTAIRTYQPKYNPFKSSELSTTTLESVSTLEVNDSPSTPKKVPIATLVEDLSTDLPFISAPVKEESSFTSSSDSPRSLPGPEEPISFPELELVSPSSLSTPSSSPPPTIASSSTSKPSISFSTTKPSSTSVFSTPILLRPSTSLSSSFKSQNLKPSLTSSFLPSVPKPSASSTPSSSSGTSIRVPKTLASSVFPSSSNRLASKPLTTLDASVPPSNSDSPAIRTAKSLPPPASPSLPQTSKSPVSTVLSSFASAPSRNPKSASLQIDSGDSANSASADYSYSYKVIDTVTNQDFGHSENRVGKNTRGRYDVLLPDGRRQVVDYQILNDSGYVADVTYQE